MRNVVLDEEERKEKFKSLLIKICRDLSVENYEIEIYNFINNIRKKVW